MKTFKVLIFAIVTLFQLTPTTQDACGEARLVQVADESRNDTKLHFPWAGAIYSVVNKTKTGDIQFICGATLLTESHSVTASHCIQDKHSDAYRRSPSEIALYFGIYDLKQRNATTGWKTDIQEIVVHPDWDPFGESYDSDIAVLKLRNPKTLTNLIAPICLWPRHYDDVESGTVITWTEPDEDDPGFWNHVHDPLHTYPQQFSMPIRSNTECFLTQPRFKTISSERTYCAGGLNSGQCLEVGNSGASMAIKVNERFYLRGIVSASFIDIAGCDNITFTLFTNVMKHQAWIIDNIKQL